MIKGCLLTVIGTFVAVVLLITALLVVGLLAAYGMLVAMLLIRLVHWTLSVATGGREWSRIKEDWRTKEDVVDDDAKDDGVEEGNEGKNAVDGEPDRGRAQAHRDPPGAPAFGGAGD